MDLRKRLFNDDTCDRMDTVRLEQSIRSFREGPGVKGSIDEDQNARIARLEHDLAETKMYLVALIRLLVKNRTVRDDEFIEALNLADVWDGDSDSGYTGSMGDARDLNV